MLGHYELPELLGGGNGTRVCGAPTHTMQIAQQGVAPPQKYYNHNKMPALSSFKRNYFCEPHEGSQSYI